MPLEHLSAVSLFANAIEELVTDKTVIVAPDFGAVKLAERYGELLGRPSQSLTRSASAEKK